MRWLDDKGRLFRLINVVDLLAVLLACAAGAAAYVMLTNPDRVSRPYPLSSARKWACVELRIPSERAWIAQFISAGLRQRDARSGETVVEVLQSEREKETGDLLVSLRVLAVEDAQGRLIQGDDLLVPGRVLRVSTDQCIFEGHVSKVAREAPE